MRFLLSERWKTVGKRGLRRRLQPSDSVLLAADFLSVMVLPRFGSARWSPGWKRRFFRQARSMDFQIPIARLWPRQDGSGDGFPPYALSCACAGPCSRMFLPRAAGYRLTAPTMPTAESAVREGERRFRPGSGQKPGRGQNPSTGQPERNNASRAESPKNQKNPLSRTAAGARGLRSSKFVAFRPSK